MPGESKDTMTVEPTVIQRMQSLAQQWEASADSRAIFLNCYCVMTQNMIAAADRREFDDPAWVNHLLRRFADYYFIALDTYEQNPEAAPAVWRATHRAAALPRVLPIQKLLMGVNAHINYDLVLALVDLLEPEWNRLGQERRASRYADHCRVNDIISQTIDAVQDQVLQPAMPVMGVIDRLLGPLDERMISRLIAGWRETVWQHAIRMIALPAPDQRAALTQQIENATLRIGDLIQLRQAL